MVVLDELLGDDNSYENFSKSRHKAALLGFAGQFKFPKHWHVMETSLSPDVVLTSVFSKQVLILELMVLSGRTRGGE